MTTRFRFESGPIEIAKVGDLITDRKHFGLVLRKDKDNWNQEWLTVLWIGLRPQAFITIYGRHRIQQLTIMSLAGNGFTVVL